jgi:hypothetical protein
MYELILDRRSKGDESAWRQHSLIRTEARPRVGKSGEVAFYLGKSEAA